LRRDIQCRTDAHAPAPGIGSRSAGSLPLLRHKANYQPSRSIDISRPPFRLEQGCRHAM